MISTRTPRGVAEEVSAGDTEAGGAARNASLRTRANGLAASPTRIALAPAFYVIAAAVITFAILTRIRETAFLPLK